ncbi:hypothetical protein PGR79_03170 [Klebsiella sp. 141161]
MTAHTAPDGTLRQRRDVRHNGEKEDFSWDDNR